MANIFAGSEVVEIGIQIEKNGRDFYNALCEKIKDDSARNIFKFLAGEEEKHIIAFQNILDGLNKNEPAESYPGEYFAYMQSLASQYIFTQQDKGREIAKAIKDKAEAVDKGIGFEKDSIVFYTGMKKVVPDYDHKIIDELIGQEQDHLKKLLDFKKAL